MRYSIQPRDRGYVKAYGFLFLAKNISKNISNEYSKKFADGAVKSGTTKIATDAIRTAKAIQKTEKATGDLVGNKIAGKITSVSKKSRKLPQNETSNEIPKERYISPKERKQIIDELRLIL